MEFKYGPHPHTFAITITIAIAIPIAIAIVCTESFTFESSASSDITTDNVIHSVIPGDFNYDGALDVMVLTSSGGVTMDGKVYTGNVHSLQFTPTATNAFQSHHQVLAMDMNGDMILDVFGTSSTSGNAVQFWRNDGVDKAFVETPLSFPNRPVPGIGSAYVDMDGDCLADLFTTTDSGNGVQFEIRVAYKTASSYDTHIHTDAHTHTRHILTVVFVAV